MNTRFPGRMLRHARRRAGGMMMADLPGALWVLLLLLTFPLLDVATIALRYSFLVATSRNAVHAAAEAKTFFTNASAGDPSAVNLGNWQAGQTAAGFSGISITQPITVNIMITNVSTGTVSVQSTPLIQPADTSNNLYSIQTAVTGRIFPLVTYGGALFGNIPGLTGPMTVSVTSEEIAENPQGLNQ